VERRRHQRAPGRGLGARAEGHDFATGCAGRTTCAEHPPPRSERMRAGCTLGACSASSFFAAATRL